MRTGKNKIYFLLQLIYTQDDIKKGLGTVTQPLLALAGVGSARTSVAGERETSPQPATSNPLVQTVRIDVHTIVMTLYIPLTYTVNH